MTVIFDYSDTAYLDWLHSHPEGYVLNRLRGSSSQYLVLHRATCDKIKKYTKMAKPGGFTERSYIKVCALHVDDLRAYARYKAGRLDGSFSAVCPICKP